jgi:simple sugar transport system ATP-binding protein
MVLQTYYKQPYSKAGIMNYKQVMEKAKTLIEKFDVRTPSPETFARALSGGNQQKAIIAREVDRSPDLLIAAQPTRGLDVGAIEFIHEQLVLEREKGRAVLLISFELEEILQVSDRIAVLYEGKTVAFLDPKETNEIELGFLMAGGKKEEVGHS